MSLEFKCLTYFINNVRNRGILIFTSLSACFMKGPMFKNVYELFTKISNKPENKF